MSCSSAALAAGLSSHLSVSHRPPDTPDEHGIWIRIPTHLMRIETAVAEVSPTVALPNQPMGRPADSSFDSTRLTAPALAQQRSLDTPTQLPASMLFRRRGESREITFDGHTVLLQDRVGFRIYAQLLARPHVRHTAVELRAGLTGLDPACFAGSTGPVIPASGIAVLRRRYEELNEELAEAEQHHDRGRQQQLEEEIARLAEEVRRALGRGGRVRQQSDAERARVAIGKALQRAREALRTHHRPLHDHLVASVSSGSVLTYRPDHQDRWDT